MILFYRDEEGHRQQVALDPARATVLGRGGAGVIYRHPDDAHQALKIYHPQFLDQHPQLSAKIEAMLRLAPAHAQVWMDGKRYVQIAWPQAMLADHQGRLRGYAMPLVDLDHSVMLEQLLQRSERRLAQLREDYRFRVYVARNLSEVVARLHEQGHGMVDLKPVNLRVYRETGFVCLLDCDGYDIRDETGTRYRAELFTGEYLYPEGYAGHLHPEGVDPLEQDRFGLAVILFQLLNNGLHPYQGRPVGADVPPGISERIAAGLYCYGRQGHPRQAPSAQSLHEFFEDDTRELFDQAFAQNHQRPEARVWSEHFHRLIDRLQPCAAHADHQHFSKGCGWCALPQGIIPAASSAALAPVGQPVRTRILGLILLIALICYGYSWFAAGPGVRQPQPPHRPAAMVPKPQEKTAPPPTHTPDQSALPPVLSIPQASPSSPVEQAALPAAPPAPGDKTNGWQDPVTGMAFVWLPGGTFSMGCGPWTGHCWHQEKPVREVTVQGFWLARTEITNRHYLHCVREQGCRPPEWLEKNGPYHYQTGRNNHYRLLGEVLAADDAPVIGISWEDVQSLVAWMNGKGHARFRLPTEAEWEYACRSGGKPENHAGGSLEQGAWYGSNSGGRIHRVATKAANGLGLFDMSGNVWEWVQDWYTPYPAVSQTDPVNDQSGSFRVNRGGSWIYGAEGVRCTMRSYDAPSFRNYNVGGRLAM